MLEKRLDAQQAQSRKTNLVGSPLTKGTPVAYEPPQPWDKKFHLGGITITPGGFFALEGVWRSRDQGADIGDEPFGSIPFGNSTLAHANEFRFSARQSRVSALVEGQVNPSTLLSGYAELDFLGAANTANSSESNSYNPRIRHLYATADWNDLGLHLLAGQTWSLVTLNSKGITPRNEVTPATIDAQYVAGFTWARQPGLRLTKELGNDVWLAASAEMSQTRGCPGGVPGAVTTSATAITAASGFAGLDVTCNQVTAGGGLLNQYYNYSINHVPDFIAKAAWEPTIGDRKLHIEGFGLYTDLYDRASYTTAAGAAGTVGSVNVNHDTTGWGAGGSVIAPIVPKWVDVQGSAMIGRGIGRYGSSQLNQVQVAPDGTLDALPEVMFLGGLTVHATPELDLYANAGMEAITSRTAFLAGTAGYAPTTANNTGCDIEFGTCSGATKRTWELTGGFWDKVYNGAYGSMRVGMQYSYVQRELFSGTGGLPAGSTPLGAKTNDNAFRFSVRYYPFDTPPAPALPAVSKY